MGACAGAFMGACAGAFMGACAGAFMGACAGAFMGACTGACAEAGEMAGEMAAKEQNDRPTAGSQEVCGLENKVIKISPATVQVRHRY